MSFANTPDFHNFKANFKGDLILPSEVGYQAGIQRWSASAQRPAALVAFVKDSADVSLAITFAIKHKLEIAVKGGGHNPSGASSTDGGIVIDLSRYLNKATCDPVKRVVSVGGGALWSEVDKVTTEHGLATVGGTVSHTGVGGLTVGGGFGHLTGEFGLVIDNLVGATVVTADGSIIHTSESEHPDLFWAIRGGGVNFGVVTTFELKCHPQIPQVFFGELFYTPDKFVRAVELCDQFEKEKMDQKQLILTGIIKTPDGIMVMVGVFHNGEEEAAREMFKDFYDHGPVMDNTGMKPYIKLNQRLDEEQAHGTHVYMCAANQTRPPSTIAQTLLEDFVKMTDNHPEFMGSFVGVEYFSTKVIRSKADHETAYNCRGYHNNVAIMIKWSDPNDLASEARSWGKRLSNIIDPGQGKDETPYGNYESDVVKGGDKVKRLFGSNYARLQKIKGKYDPNMVFNKWFPIAPIVE